MHNGIQSTLPVSCSNNPLSGLWQPNIRLQKLFYGQESVHKHLTTVLPSLKSRVFVITGHSIASKTPLLQDLEKELGQHYAGAFSGIRQHGPAEDVDTAFDQVLQDEAIDTILSVGGGSPIDSAKTICYRLAEKTGKWLHHISIPTTLSAAECTAGGGYTKADGVKVGFMAPEMAIKAIVYDPYYASFTPLSLWLSTGMRAMDHAVECFYHPHSSEIWKAQALWAAQSLFQNLPQAKANHPNDHDLTTKLQLAAFLSSGLKGSNLKGGMGMSHSLGHALGSPYGIGHGFTSCMTLGKVVRMKAKASGEDAKQIARLLPAAGGQSSGDIEKDAVEVGDRLSRLVRDLDIYPGTLTERGVKRSESSIITSRACGGLTEGPVYDSVFNLVESLF